MKNLWQGRELKALMVEKESYHYINGLDVRIAFGESEGALMWRWCIARKNDILADGSFTTTGINVEEHIIQLARGLSIA